MTTYFDELQSELRQLDPSEYESMERARLIENRLVRDVSICAEFPFPGIPAGLRDAIHLQVVQHGFFSKPIAEQPNLEDSTILAELGTLISNLHSIFHSIGVWSRESSSRAFSDSPLAPLQYLADNAAERRVVLDSANPALPPPLANESRGDVGSGNGGWLACPECESCVIEPDCTGLFYDGQSARCECGALCAVSCDSENPAEVYIVDESVEHG